MASNIRASFWQYRLASMALILGSVVLLMVAFARHRRA